MENELWEYKLEGDAVCLLRLKEDVYEARVPDMIDGHPVCMMEKKACLSKKKLRRVILPESIRQVGDWAFAYCNHLQEVVVEAEDIRFGRNVFLECGELARIFCRGKAGGMEELLAAAVCAMDAYYLLEPEAVGSPPWLEKWDARLGQLLKEPDGTGFSKLLLCGEEDYEGKDNDYDTFLTNKRKKKLRLAFLRLRYPLGLHAENKQELETYLRSYARNGESAGLSWQLLVEEHGNEKDYFRIFTDSGCMTRENTEVFLLAAGGHPQLMAWVLAYKQENFGYEDIMDSFSLDF